MAQPQRKEQPEAFVTRKPLSREEALRIAKQSHARLRAQRGDEKKELTPDTERIIINKDEDKLGTHPTQRIQVQLVKKEFPTNHQAQPPRPIYNKTAVTQPQIKAQSAPPLPGDHLTKDGLPDRRYAENRSMPPLKRRDSVGVHRTKNGAPDRRYLENQHLSQIDAEVEKAKFILQKAGVPIKE